MLVGSNPILSRQTSKQPLLARELLDTKPGMNQQSMRCAIGGVIFQEKRLSNRRLRQFWKNLQQESSNTNHAIRVSITLRVIGPPMIQN